MIRLNTVTGSALKLTDVAGDQSRDMWFEVRQVSGSCPTSGKWTLTLTGNVDTN